MLNRAGSNWKDLEATEEKPGLAGLKLSDTTSLSLSKISAKHGKTCGVGRKSLAACSISALASLETFWRPIGDSSTEGMRGD
jgi:hypothetical protein